MRFLVLCFSMLSIAFPGNVISNTVIARHFKKSDPRFDKYKREFQLKHHQYTGRVIEVSSWNINVVPDLHKYHKGLPKNSIGVCLRRSKEILLLKKHVESSSYFELEELIFHELGHGPLDLNHKDTIYEERHVSIMRYSMFEDTKFYQKHREALLRELFTGDISLLIKGIRSDESH